MQTVAFCCITSLGSQERFNEDAESLDVRHKAVVKPMIHLTFLSPAFVLRNLFDVLTAKVIV